MFGTCCILTSVKAPVRPAHHCKAVELPVAELTNVPAPIIPGKGSTAMFDIFLEVALICAALHLEKTGAMLLCAQVRAFVREFLGRPCIGDCRGTVNPFGRPQRSAAIIAAVMWGSLEPTRSWQDHPICSSGSLTPVTTSFI